MGTQRPVVIGEEELGSPIAEHHGKKKEKQAKKDKVKEKIKEEKFKKETEPQAVVQEEKETAVVTEEKPLKKTKVGKAKIRSKKYQNVLTLFDAKKIHNIKEAIELVKKISISQFDANVEIHIRLLSKTGKPETVRGLLQYPHPTGKKIQVVILDEKTMAEIEKTKKANADIYLAAPKIMPQVAKLAKILGPKGKMPNPKAGTITDDPEKTKKELEGGKIEYKTDSGGNLHQVIGKVSADNTILTENYNALLAVLPLDKITSITMCATMGPGIKVTPK